jgi:hypothetical protein
MSHHFFLPPSFARRVVQVTLMSFAIIACQPDEPCGLDSDTFFPDIGVQRIQAVDAEGIVIPASLRREYEDGSISKAVPLDQPYELDRTKLKGRSAMTVIVSAAGFVDARVNLPETCEVSVTPMRVSLTRLP